MTYIPPPKLLPAFPNTRRVKGKTRIKGGGIRRRWEDSKFIFEWDGFHGKVEKYNKRGNHLGEFDPVSGEQTKEPDPVRFIEP